MKQIYFIVCIGCCVILFVTFTAVNQKDYGASILHHEKKIQEYQVV